MLCIIPIHYFRCWFCHCKEGYAGSCYAIVHCCSVPHPQHPIFHPEHLVHLCRLGWRIHLQHHVVWSPWADCTPLGVSKSLAQLHHVLLECTDISSNSKGDIVFLLQQSGGWNQDEHHVWVNLNFWFYLENLRIWNLVSCKLYYYMYVSKYYVWHMSKIWQCVDDTCLRSDKMSLGVV